VPRGKELPEGGVETTFGTPPQESEAVTVKNTAIGPLLVTVIFVGHSMERMQLGLTTVTVKLQLVLPLVSLAVLVTVVVPMGKELPEGGVELTVGIPPQESDAVTVK